MKAVILAGGKGTRISEETKNIPKPMILVGGKPLLHHIIDGYASQGVKEFIVLTGYKSEIIYGYFYSLSDTAHQQNGQTTFCLQDISVTLLYSGLEPQTGGRLSKVRSLVQEDFFFTYGDGLSDIDIWKVHEMHQKHHPITTISGVRPVPRFGSVLFDSDGKVLDFGEKQEHLSGWINGGFAVMSPNIFSYIHSDDCNLEKDVYPELVRSGKLYSVCHDGFWQCVDTLRDLEMLEEVHKENGTIWIK